jgi:hypothetical protein
MPAIGTKSLPNKALRSRPLPVYIAGKTKRHLVQPAAVCLKPTTTIARGGTEYRYALGAPTCHQGC